MADLAFQEILEDIPRMEKFFLDHPELFIPDPDDPDDQEDLAEARELVRAIGSTSSKIDSSKIKLPLNLILLLLPTQCRPGLLLGVLSVSRIFQIIRFRFEMTEAEIETVLGINFKAIFRIFKVQEPSDHEYEIGCQQLQRLVLDVLRFDHSDVYWIASASMPYCWYKPSYEMVGDGAPMFLSGVFNELGEPVRVGSSDCDSYSSDDPKIVRRENIMARIPEDPKKAKAKRIKLFRETIGCGGDCDNCHKPIC